MGGDQAIIAGAAEGKLCVLLRRCKVKSSTVTSLKKDSSCANGGGFSFAEP